MKCIVLLSALLIVMATKGLQAADQLGQEDGSSKGYLDNDRFPTVAPAATPQLVDAPIANQPGPVGSAAYTGSVPSFLLGKSQLTAEILSGFRYDSDANQAIDTLTPGQTGAAVTPSTLQKQPDWSFFTLASMTHQYTFQAIANTTWQTNASVSSQQFFHISPNYDLTVAAADSGPRFAVGKLGQANVSIRPFGAAAWIGYNGDTYSSLYGGGLSVDVRAQRWWTTVYGVGRFGNYQDSAFRPLTRLYTGPEWQLGASTTFKLNAVTAITAVLSWYQASSRSENLGRQGPAGSITFTRDFVLLRRTAELVTGGSFQRLRYGGPPPQIPATTRRDDTQWIGNLSLGVPIAPSAVSALFRATRAIFEYQYLRSNSNYFPFIDHEFTIRLKIAL